MFTNLCRDIVVFISNVWYFHAHDLILYNFTWLGIFERFRGILHEGEIDKRVQFLIEGLFAVRKAKFQVLPFTLLTFRS